MIKGGYQMKKIGVLAVVLAVAFLFVGVASAEMYVEGYLGAAQAENLDIGTSSQRCLQSRWHGTLQV